MPGSSPISFSKTTSAAAALQVCQDTRGTGGNQAHSSCKAAISDEMYEAVTRCFLCCMHSLAIVGWKGTGSRLG